MTDKKANISLYYITTLSLYRLGAVRGGYVTCDYQTVSYVNKPCTKGDIVQGEKHSAFSVITAPRMTGGEGNQMGQTTSRRSFVWAFPGYPCTTEETEEKDKS